MTGEPIEEAVVEYESDDRSLDVVLNVFYREQLGIPAGEEIIHTMSFSLPEDDEACAPIEVVLTILDPSGHNPERPKIIDENGVITVVGFAQFVKVYVSGLGDRSYRVAFLEIRDGIDWMDENETTMRVNNAPYNNPGRENPREAYFVTKQQLFVAGENSPSLAFRADEICHIYLPILLRGDTVVFSVVPGEPVPFLTEPTYPESQQLVA